MRRLRNSSYALRLRCHFYTLFYYNFSNFLLRFVYKFICSMILASDGIRTIFIVISPRKYYVKRHVTLTKNGKSKIFYFSRNNILRISRYSNNSR